MFSLIITIIFIWLLVKAICLGLKLTWGIAKVTAGILIAISLPLLIVCLLFVGGIALLVPVAVIAIAVGVLKSCV